MKRIIVFRKGEYLYDSLRMITDYIIDHLRRAQIEVTVFDMASSDEDILSSYQRLLNEHYDAAFSISSFGEHVLEWDGKNIFDLRNMPFYDYILDHPLEHDQYLLNHGDNFHAICIDKQHADFIKRHYPSVKSASFLPLGAVGNIQTVPESFESFHKREYDIVFTGSHMNIDGMIDEIKLQPTAISRITLELINYLLNNRTDTIEKGLTQVLLHSFNEADISEDLMHQFISLAADLKVLPYIRTYIREEQLRLLAKTDIPIHVFGNGWDDLSAKWGGSIVWHQSVNYDQIPAIYQKAKIVLNTMVTFKDGQHDRIPLALSAGSNVLTDYSLYLDENLSDLVYFYDISAPQTLGNQIQTLLSQESILYDKACRGKSYALSHMTWDCHVQQLINILNET